jgi:excinuclease ABC subunit A
LRGSGKDEIPFRYDEGGRVYEVTRNFEGVIPNMERRYRETDSNWIREEFERYQNTAIAAPVMVTAYDQRHWL